MRYSPFLRPFTLALLLAGSSPAATLVYNAELDLLSNNSAGSLQSTNFSSLGPLPKLNGTLNAGDQFQFTFSAPTGFLFQIFPTPAGSPFSGFSVQFATSSLINNSVETPGGSVSFSGATSPLPVPTRQFLGTGDQGEFAAIIEFPLEDFTFKSITATFTVPSGYSRTFTDFTPAVAFIVAGYSSRSDLGPAATLVADNSPAVPEPSSALLIPGAFALLALGKRLRQQRSRAH